jgi:hypothetical protein
MKTKLFLIAVIICAATTITFAQDSITKKGIHIGSFNLTDATITAGKGAVTSGFDTRVDFSNPNGWVIFVQANNDRAMVNIGKKIGKNFTIIQSIGQYKNAPWTGPMIIFKANVFKFMAFDAMLWGGCAFATDKILSNPGYKPQFFMSYDGMGITLFKNHRIGGAVLWLKTDQMNWFISYKGTIPIGKKSKLFGEVTYNHNLNIPMFVIGYSIKLTD